MSGRLGGAWAATTPASRVAAIAALVASVVVATAVAPTEPMRYALALCGLLFVAAALVDVAEYRIPNVLMAAAACVIATGVVLSRDLSLAVGAVVGMVVAGAAMLSVRIARGVGMGDVKMAAVVGLGCGAVAVIAAPSAIAAAALLAATFGLLSGRSRLPLAPSLWAGWCVALVGVRLLGVA